MMLRFCNTWFLLLGLLLSTGLSLVHAQHKIIKTFPVRTFYEDNGLISNNILASAQSSSGILWFGTPNGISTFDGIRWGQVPGSESFPFAHRSMLYPLPGDSMIQLGFDPHGSPTARLYHAKGHVQLGSFPKSQKAEKASAFNAAVQHSNGKTAIAMLTSSHLWLLEGLESKWKKVKLPAAISYHDVSKLIYYQKSLHLATRKGLYTYNANRSKFQELWPSELGDKTIVSATTSPDGQLLYLLGNNWLAFCSNNRLQFLLRNLNLPDKDFSAADSYNILTAQNDLLIFQINNSLFLLNVRSGFLEPFRLTNSFATATPTTILQDNEQNIWFGTLRGAAMLNSFRFSNLDKVVGLPDSEISTIYEIDSGTVLLGSNLGINVLKDYQWVQKAQGDISYSNTQSRILDATRLNEHQIAIAGNQQGLGILSESENYKTRWYPLPDGQLAVSLLKLKNQLLIGTDKGKVLTFKEGKFSTFLDVKSTTYIRRLYAQPDHTLLVLTANGLYRTTPHGHLEHLLAPTQGGSNLYSIVAWKDHLLLGTKAGMYQLLEDQIIPFNEIMPLQRPVYTMLTDKRGALWIGSDKGVFVYDGKQLKSYTRLSGLAGHEINRSALVEMKDDRIWIGTDRGLSIYDPHYDYQRSIVPLVRLQEIRADDQVLSKEADHELSHNQNSLEFFFQPISFYQPEALQYRYRLAGLEENWNYSSSYQQTSVRYASLPPGNYRFILQAHIDGGTWSDEISSSEVVIAAPFYLSGWFFALAVLVVGFIGYISHSLLLHKSNEKRLNAAINEKVRQTAQSEAKFQAIWESMDTSVLVCDRRGRIKMCNPSFCRLFDAEANALVGREVSDIIPHSHFTKESLAEWYAQPSLMRFEIELKTGIQHHYLLTTFSYLEKLSPGEPLLLIGLKNISHQKEAEMKNLRLNELLVRQNRDLVKKELELAAYNRELLKRQKELQTAMQGLEERNFELDQFVYKTSHDLRAPIASSIGLLNIMQMEGASAEWPRYIELIMRSLQKQDSFIKAMLNFSKTARASEKPELIDFEQLVEQCLTDLQYIPGYEGIKKSIRVQGAGTDFYSDKMKINIVLSNILSNAIKYRDTRKASRLEVMVEVESDQSQILISDNGIGVNKDYLKHIFDMFYRATEKSDGSGLGLYIVKQTIERLGGSIEVNSELGVGSCFKITIPNLVSAAESTQTASQQFEKGATAPDQQNALL